MLPVVKYYVFGGRWLLITYVQGMMNALYEHAGSGYDIHLEHNEQLVAWIIDDKSYN